MEDTEKQQEENPTEENLLGAGQRILGNIETIGGILTGDPVTTAEGEFNAAVGATHQESSRILAATEDEGVDNDLDSNEESPE